MKIKEKTGVRYRRGYPHEVMAEAIPIEGRTRLCSSGFTLLELLIVCAVLGVLVTIAIPGYTQLKNTAKVGRSAEEIRGLEKVIAAYQADRGILPNFLSDIPGLEIINDPWSHPYVYLKIGNTPTLPQQRYDGHGTYLNEDFDLFSTGEDGLTTYDLSVVPVNAPSENDIVRGSDGAYVGRADHFL